MAKFLAETVGGLPIDLSGWWACDDEPGRRVFWDGGITVGMDAKNVPWAGPDAKGDSTGFWSPNGNVAPLRRNLYKHLPRMPMEGVINKEREFSVYAAPPLDAIFRTRKIKPGWEIEYWRVKEFFDDLGFFYLESAPVDTELLNLREVLEENSGPVFLRHYVKFSIDKPLENLHFFLEHARKRGAKAALFRHPQEMYQPGISPYFRSWPL